jgi:hypothetical protein
MFRKIKESMLVEHTKCWLCDKYGHKDDLVDGHNIVNYTPSPFIVPSGDYHSECLERNGFKRCRCGHYWFKDKEKSK